MGGKYTYMVQTEFGFSLIEFSFAAPGLRRVQEAVGFQVYFSKV